MHKVSQFLKMTLIGGLVIILPVALIFFLLLKAMDNVQKVLQPIVSLLPEAVILPKVMALLIVIVGCFLTGLYQVAIIEVIISGKGVSPVQAQAKGS